VIGQRDYPSQSWGSINPIGLSTRQLDPSRARLGTGQHPHERNARRLSFHKGDEDLFAQLSRQFVIGVELFMPMSPSVFRAILISNNIKKT
jgi:hypothetical protein